ncbi:MAG: PspC domain-containing protein [Anaerolineae bacterium]|nr:PspC domain-containing protein [Anaerolineae bacterium]
MSEPKRLLRSRTNRQLAGVCGGLGEYFGIDPTLLRIAFILMVVFGGSGLLLYIILALVIPEG